MKLTVFILLAIVALSLFCTAPNVVFATAVYRQTPPLEPQDAVDLYGLYYREQDQARKYELGKQFLEKYPNVDPYWKNGPQKFIARYELSLIYKKCQDADKAYFGSPSEANLNSFLGACDSWIAKAPAPDPFYSTRVALGTGYGVLAGFYKDTDRGFRYAEKGLRLIEPTAAPPNWPPADWIKFREENIGRLLQYQGLFMLRKSPADLDSALAYLDAAIKHREGPAFKDPNSYLLRAEIITYKYTSLSSEYEALPNEDKTGDKGKTLLAKIDPLVTSLANDYARIVLLTEGNLQFRSIYNDAVEEGQKFYKYLSPHDLNGFDRLVSYFKSDFGARDLAIRNIAPPPAPTPNPAPNPVVNSERVALIIGNSKYNVGPLTNPVNDAADLAVALKNAGFKVTKLTNLSKREMIDAINAFGNNIPKGAVALFYYAGHGIQVSGTNYLVPLDAQIQRESDVEFECVDIGRVLGKLDSADTKMNIIILDACRNNPFSRGFRNYSRGLAVISAMAGTIIAYSAAPGQVASDGDGRNGIYTQELLKMLKMKGMKIEDVFKKTRESVVTITKRQQVPWENSSIIGDFYFLQ